MKMERGGAHVEEIGADTREHVAREGAQELPRRVERGEDVAGLVMALAEELGFELLHKLKVKLVLIRERLLADDGLHGNDVLADGVVGVELVRYGRVILTRHLGPNGVLHQTRQGRQHVNGRVDLAVV